MPNFFAIGDLLASILLAILPRRISDRIKQNTSPLSVYVLRESMKLKCDKPRMTKFEGVFATLLFDLALFGTSNPVINGIIYLFTTIQNSWDTPFKNEAEAEHSITEFCHRLDIQHEPWIWEKAPSKYASLNDFFSRTYTDDHFPRLGAGMVIAPACCTMQIYNNEETMKSVLIKGCEYDIDRIGLPKEDLKSYANHQVILGYLSPSDYHRIHSPITGRCTHCKLEGGASLSASVKFFGGKFNILNENKRLVIVLETNEGLRVALVIVGGVGVNTITFEKSILGKEVQKGQELSAFRAGGSAFAMFSTKPLSMVKELIEVADRARGDHVEVQVGETLAGTPKAPLHAIVDK
ncbi:phosphatidylserine decarboxylase proenzyme [Skeletonema marinoi]|uniref:Phosphatidylserine decarboxylase proenzyme n=1 Tax=Skeletonema marinoi TaxID=267567 RepID=A0AAD8Y282_9STRA|nr:phosphatidylserine decarboxylase proenzyme [Skeletonema marinoi]